jgi:DNA-binding Xre family transcriptional regulator
MLVFSAQSTFCQSARRTGNVQHTAADGLIFEKVEQVLHDPANRPTINRPTGRLRYDGFGQRHPRGLRGFRERLGLNLTDVSERSGIDRATLSKLETGKVPNPTVSTLRAVAHALNKRLSWLLIDEPAGAGR